MNHTPTPWRVDYRDVERYGNATISGPRRNNVAQVWGGSKPTAEIVRANADLIVRAVNSHDELVAALEGARTMLADLDTGYPRRELHKTPTEMLAQIDAALAKAVP